MSRNIAPLCELCCGSDNRKSAVAPSPVLGRITPGRPRQAVALRRDELRESDYSCCCGAGLAELVLAKNCVGVRLSSAASLHLLLADSDIAGQQCTRRRLRNS